jgi:hypothetical protein
MLHYCGSDPETDREGYNDCFYGPYNCVGHKFSPKGAVYAVRSSLAFKGVGPYREVRLHHCQRFFFMF